MSKRKSSEDLEYLKSKLKRLEREVFNSRKRNVRVMRIPTSSSSSSERSSPSPPPPSRRSRRSEPRDRRKEKSEKPLDHGAVQDKDIVDVLYGHSPSAASRRARSPSKQDPRAVTVTIAAMPAPVAVAHTTTSAIAATDSSASAGLSAVVAPFTSVTPSTALLPTEPDPEPGIDQDLMEILGIDPTQSINFGPEIHKEVAVRFEHCTTIGLTKEVRKELSEKYLIPSNCKLVDAPALNPEIKAALTEPVVKRDKAIEAKQKLLASAVSSLGKAITLLLSLDQKQPELLRLLIDTGRVLCDCQHNDSQTRRNYVLSSLKKDLKEQMKLTKIDSMLFGQNFQETLKTAKAINKSGADLKAPSAFTNDKQRMNTKPTPGTSKNWRNPASNRKPAQTSKRATTPTPTKNPRASSSKSSQRGKHSRR